MSPSPQDIAKVNLAIVVKEMISDYSQRVEDQKSITEQGYPEEERENKRMLDSLKARLDALNYVNRQASANQGLNDYNTELFVTIENSVRSLESGGYDGMDQFGISSGLYPNLSLTEAATFKRKVLLEAMARVGYHVSF